MSEVIINDINKKDHWDRTLLHDAAKCNDLPKVKKLLALGAKINAKDKYGFTPLHYAAQFNDNKSYFEVIELLLKRGAVVNAQDVWGRTPFFYLVKKCDMKTVLLFLKYNADIYALCKNECNLLFPAALQHKNIEVVQLFVNAGLEVNHQSNDGKTPLHWTCTGEGYNNIKIMKCFLKNGAYPNAVDHYKFTPLSLAMINWHFYEEE